ncbi:MAG: N-acetylneuraminate synthase, partial [Opitutae bacterium]|nr:N-acetylneuraminate synthase [Opitutae bacterium]
MRGLFGKSVAPARALEAGTVLTEEMLVARKPGTGIPYAERDRLVGRKLKVAVEPLRLLDGKDIDE